MGVQQDFFLLFLMKSSISYLDVVLMGVMHNINAFSNSTPTLCPDVIDCCDVCVFKTKQNLDMLNHKLFLDAAGLLSEQILTFHR